MDEQLKNIIEKVIEMKESEVQGLNFKDMADEEKKEHEEIFNKIETIEDQLRECLGKEQWSLVAKYANAISRLNGIEQHYMFKKGVNIGLTDLYFIREELGNAAVSL